MGILLQSHTYTRWASRSPTVAVLIVALTFDDGSWLVSLDQSGSIQDCRPSRCLPLHRLLLLAPYLFVPRVVRTKSDDVGRLVLVIVVLAVRAVQVRLAGLVGLVVLVVLVEVVVEAVVVVSS